MSTRAIIRFATREEGVSFSEHPEKWHAQLYSHGDGYPEGLGLDIADSLVDSTKINGIEIDSLDTQHGDLDYIYYIWQHLDKSTWISIFKADYGLLGENLSECIFVGEPMDLQTKYDR
jgi:hypothetical protein